MRKLLKLAVIGAVVAGAVKMLGMQKQQWEGLTETEARAKLDAKLPGKMPAEKRAEVTDKIVGAMKEKGALKADEPAPEEPTPDEPAPEESAPEEPVSEESAGEEPAPEQSGSDDSDEARE